MVNTNVQSPIPLAGRGYTQRDTKNYDMGEYPVLNNVFITDQGLQSRYGVHTLSPNPYSGVFNATKFFVDICGFIGSFSYPNRTYPLLGGKGSLFGAIQEAPGQTFTNSFWTDADFVGHTNTSFSVPVKAFTYQDRNVVVRMKANEVAGAIASFDYHWGNQGTGNTIPATWNLIANRPVAVTAGSPDQDFIDAFAWKDRLWLVTKDTIYFSGIGTVANHQNFASPVGGFVKYTDTIKSVQFLKDSLYVICEREVHVLTYSTDPNTDAVNNIVSATQGGDSSCIHEGTVYMTDGISLFTVSGNGVEKAIDLELFERYPTPGTQNGSTTLPNQIQTKMIAYKNKIVLIYFDASKFGNTGTDSVPFINRGIKLAFSGFADGGLDSPEPFHDQFSEFSNTFMIDMENGSITKFMFRDQRLESFNGYIVDAVTFNDENGEPCLYLLTSANRNSPGLASKTPGSTYNFLYRYLDESSEFDTNIHGGNKSWDKFYSHAFGAANPASISVISRAVIPFSVYIKKFVPDGNEYLMKKFRSLMMMGNLPEYTRFNKFFGEVAAWEVASTFIEVADTSSEMFNPKSYRFPLKQRGRSISLTFYRNSTQDAVDLVASSDEGVNGDLFLMEDLRLLWTYTSKPQRTYGGSNPAIL